MKLLRTKLLAATFGGLIAALATNAFGYVPAGCTQTEGPFYADVPIDKVVAVFVDNNKGPEAFLIEWGDGTASRGSSPGYRPNLRNGYYTHAVGGVHTYSGTASGMAGRVR
jgi:hypothetical protein